PGGPVAGPDGHRRRRIVHCIAAFAPYHDQHRSHQEISRYRNHINSRRQSCVADRSSLLTGRLSRGNQSTFRFPPSAFSSIIKKQDQLDFLQQFACFDRFLGIESISPAIKYEKYGMRGRWFRSFGRRSRWGVLCSMVDAVRLRLQFRGKTQMSLRTRQNPENGTLEVLVNEEWVRFELYREQQIDDAYQNSIKFLRDRLGEDSANEMAQKAQNDNSE